MRTNFVEPLLVFGVAVAVLTGRSSFGSPPLGSSISDRLLMHVCGLRVPPKRPQHVGGPGRPVGLQALQE